MANNGRFHGLDSNILVLSKKPYVNIWHGYCGGEKYFNAILIYWHGYCGGE
jgi:hypothetical protein